jgi:hypothetical protein
LVVRGVLNLQGIVSACGADGLAGVTYNSTVWQFGSAGESGHDADTPLRGQTSGGKGGDGGRGGDGGFGGKGGGGGGGAGGTIQIAASYITWGGVVDVSGGTGAVDVASSGLFRSRSDYDDAYNDFKAPVASRRNPYCSYDNTGVFLTGATDTNGNTANIDIITLPGIGTVGSELVGGPDTFGLAAADAAGSTADTNTPATVPLLFYTPPNAFGGVLRINTATLPELFFVNMTTLPLGQPALAVNRSGDPVQVPIRPLQVRGSRREPLFIPGAQGAQILTNLAPLNTWTTFLHAGDATASASFTPYSTPVTVSLVMSGQQGVYPTLWLLDTGLLSVGTTISTPVVVDRQTNSGACAPQTRAGVSGTVTVQIKNVGHPLSLMSSIAGSDATFSNLPPLAQSFDVSWGVGTSTNLGVQPPVSFKVASDAGTVNLTANLNVIGPIPLFNLTSGGSAGPVLVGQSASLIFSALNNFQVDPFAFSPPPHALYDLHILGVTVSGPDAAFFTLTGATNGLAPINTSIYGGANTNPWTTSVVFAPNAYRAYNATLSVLTDVNVAAGQPGKLFTYQLSGSGTNLGISISQQPADTLAQPGHMASFSVTAAAYGVASPLTYQWFRGASPVPYATNATYTSGPLSSTDNGAVFSCALSATPFAVSSAAANLIVVDTSTPYPQAVLADNPLLYYRFEEPPTVGTAYDSSTNGYNGLYYTDLSHADSASPSLGSSAVFHGDANPGMILCHGIPYLRTQFSVEAWAYLESWNTNTDSHGKYGISSIFSTGDSVQGSFRMGAVNSNIFQFNVAGAIDIDGVSDFQVTNNSYTTGKWFHLVAVYDLDNALFNFYVNGSLADSIALYDGGGSALIYPAVGAWWSTNGISRFLDGRVDELAIYGTPLTADRVAAHYQAAFAAVMGPLLTGTRQGGGLQLSWSSGPGFMLQQTTNPGDPSSWSNVTGGNISPVTVNLSLSKQFFRLRKL